MGLVRIFILSRILLLQHRYLILYILLFIINISPLGNKKKKPVETHNTPLSFEGFFFFFESFAQWGAYLMATILYTQTAISGLKDAQNGHSQGVSNSQWSHLIISMNVR